MSDTVYCAIDFGTTRTAAGYLFEGKQELCYPNNPKQSSVIVYKHDAKDGRNKLWKYGEEAVAEYPKALNVKEDKYYFFSKFKMGLTKPKIENNGVLFDTIQVIADFLRCVRLNLEGAFKENHKKELSQFKRRWCLTLPAIWETTDKMKMTEAAYRAGLVDTPNPTTEKLLLVMEPECNVACCRAVLEQCHSLKVEGKAILVVSATDSVINITCHQIKGGKYVEVVKGLSNRYGSDHLNHMAKEWFNKKFGEEVIKKYEEVRKSDSFNLFYVLFRNFIYSIKENKDCKFYVTPGFRSFISKEAKDKLHYIKEDEEEASFVEFTKADIQSFFEDTITNTKIQIDDLIKLACSKLQNVDYTCLVGEFGNCYILQAAVKQSVIERSHYTRIPNPDHSIIEGGLWISQNQSVLFAKVLFE